MKLLNNLSMFPADVVPPVATSRPCKDGSFPSPSISVKPSKESLAGELLMHANRLLGCSRSQRSEPWDSR